MSHVISARIDDDQYRFLTKVAKKRRRKISEVFVDALNYYFDEFADYSIALERLNDPTDEIISGKELMKRLGWSDKYVRNPL